MTEYICIPYNDEGSINAEYDNLACLHSGAFADIMGEKQKHLNGTYATGYLKLSHGKDKIYLKFKAMNGIRKSEVMLSYTNMCRLGIAMKKDAKVSISKSCLFPFLWKNCNASIRVPFRFTIWGFALSVIATIISLIK